jgi:phospholipid/cholesterol/gamma-HCH transport system ATP-binding protein
LGTAGQWGQIGGGVAFALAAAATFGLAMILTQHEAGALDGRLRTASTMTLAGLVALATVGLQGGFDLMPAQLSGGMRKRAALARALALEPKLLFLDEPGSGLDPLNTARLDALVLELRHHLGTTVVMVTHDIASVFAVADRALYLDEQAMTMTALGAPQDLLQQGPPAVQRFLGSARALEIAQ